MLERLSGLVPSVRFCPKTCFSRRCSQRLIGLLDANDRECNAFHNERFPSGEPALAVRKLAKEQKSKHKQQVNKGQRSISSTPSRKTSKL